jgi:acyl carrier protein
MTRSEIEKKVNDVMLEEFEIENPGMDDDLREVHNFDSIDAIALLEIIDELMDPPLSQEEKKSAMNIRTIRQICDYIEEMLKKR